jgi:hypothetical protein
MSLGARLSIWGNRETTKGAPLGGPSLRLPETKAGVRVSTVSIVGGCYGALPGPG